MRHHRLLGRLGRHRRPHLQEDPPSRRTSCRPRGEGPGPVQWFPRIPARHARPENKREGSHKHGFLAPGHRTGLRRPVRPNGRHPGPLFRRPEPRVPRHEAHRRCPLPPGRGNRLRKRAGTPVLPGARRRFRRARRPRRPASPSARPVREVLQNRVRGRREETRRRLHAHRDRRLDRARRRQPPETAFQRALARRGRQHPRPVHRHRHVHRPPPEQRPYPRAGPGTQVRAGTVGQRDHASGLLHRHGRH